MVAVVPFQIVFALVYIVVHVAADRALVDPATIPVAEALESVCVELAQPVGVVAAGRIEVAVPETVAVGKIALAAVVDNIELVAVVDRTAIVAALVDRTGLVAADAL